MRRIALTVPLLLLVSFGCHRATTDAKDLGSPNLTSAVVSSPSDEQIVATLQDAMLKSRVVEPQSGDVLTTAVGGVVTLRGHVGTASAKQRIRDLAVHTPGAKDVIDELEAPEPNPSLANDVAMTQAIQQRLGARQDDDVRVTTVDAKVTLEGSVPTETEKAEIQKLAMHTPNVLTVENRLVMRPLSKP
jgi:osmotically-inducible protein OsmY